MVVVMMKSVILYFKNCKDFPADSNCDRLPPSQSIKKPTLFLVDQLCNIHTAWIWLLICFLLFLWQPSIVFPLERADKDIIVLSECRAMLQSALTSEINDPPSWNVSTTSITNKCKWVNIMKSVAGVINGSKIAYFSSASSLEQAYIKSTAIGNTLTPWQRALHKISTHFLAAYAILSLHINFYYSYI